MILKFYQRSIVIRVQKQELSFRRAVYCLQISRTEGYRAVGISAERTTRGGNVKTIACLFLVLALNILEVKNL